jgi:beta-glucuronidase
VTLNGKPLALRGLCVHEDDRNTGRCTSEEDVRKRFADLRAMGANVARLSHYPHHEMVARIADEEGMLLWAEIPVYWAIAFDNAQTYENAQNQLIELIRRDANRASVILWGVGNENADTEARLAFMRGLAQAARAEDPSRLIAAACLINRETFRIEDRLTEHLDIIGLNEYFGWYESGFERLERLLANSTPDRPVVISETGAEAAPGLHGPESQLFTEERQALVLTRQVEIAASARYVAGVFVWLLYDFRSDRRQTRYQRGWNRKGVIAEDKSTRKLGFDALTRAYAQHFKDKE